MSLIADYEQTRDFAVRYLGYAPRTRKQLHDKLSEKDFSSEAIDAVMHLLTEKGYLDDIAFAQNYISHKTRVNNYGKRRIIVGLLQKGIAKEDIQAAYSAILDEGSNNEEIEAAKKALSKYISKKGSDDKQKLMAFLMRRGFSYDIIKKAMAEESL